MKKIILLASAMILLALSGCARKQILIHQESGAGGAISYPDNTWAKETNVEENIGIADLEKNIPVKTVENTVITEETTRVKMERVRFPVAEYNRLAKVGKGTVKGNIFLKDAYAKRMPGRSTRLYLNPVTSYSKQWYDESYLGGYKMQKADSRLFNYLRFTASDKDGRFAFYGVPTGSYYLIGTVKCGSECGYATPKSIRIATQVTVKGNQVIEKSLTRLVD